MSVSSLNTLDRRSSLLFALIVVLVISVLCIAISLLAIHSPKKKHEKYTGPGNVLLIVVDDLRPALRCYDDAIAITPNIDALATKSLLFKNAYAQQALGGPSRISLLTGKRPDQLHLVDEGSYWRDTVGNFVTLPEHFLNYGYETISVGKVFQHGTVSNSTDDYPYSWSHPPFWPSSQEYETDQVCQSEDGQSHLNLICPVDVENQPLGTLPDIESTEYAIEFLKNKSSGPNKTDPFFLAVGYHKPHIPFRVPRRYFDLYPDMDLAPNHTLQPNFPKVSWNPFMDIRNMDDVKELNVSFPYGSIPENFQKLIRQGYYASVSYIDDLVGKLLEALEETGYAEYTTIVLLGDHGWSLGEHQEWSKYSNFEVSLRIPLIIHLPGFTDGTKRKPFKYTSVLDLIASESNTLQNYYHQDAHPAYSTKDLVELVDVFPTLAEIASLPVPPICLKNITEFCSEGISFYPIIEHLVFDPWITFFSWKTAVFSQYPRPSLFPRNDSDQPALKDILIMGYSMRTDMFRYTEWVAYDNKYYWPDWPLIISRELYKHSDDPFETQNLSEEDDLSNTLIEFSKRLKAGWKNELPPGFFESV